MIAVTTDPNDPSRLEFGFAPGFVEGLTNPRDLTTLVNETVNAWFDELGLIPNTDRTRANLEHRLNSVIRDAIQTGEL